MRITTQLLKQATSHPLHEVEYVDLSNQEIVAIERLGPCRQLQSLVLRSNCIDVIRNIECCRQLWHIDLTGNRVKSLHGLSRFPVLGMLSVGFNDLDWAEVKTLSHIRLICLTLVGNSKLDTNPHYRELVIDLLPHLWVLDGMLITANERKKVVKFFSKSHSSDNPVRKKSSDSVFVPSSMKNLMVTGVFGEKSTHLMSRFPVNYSHNIDMDKRRLKYLAHTLQDDLELRTSTKYLPSPIPPPPVPRFESLLDHREREIEQCNMLLLLLLAFLEYGLPLDVMRATLETAKLTNIGDVNCLDVLTLPADVILHSISLLLNAAVISRQEKREGGLYDKLFQSLCYTRDKVHRKLLSHQAKRHNSPPRKHSQAEEAKHAQLRCLLASEVVHLMCLVPLFFESLETHRGLMKMVVIATKSPNVADIIGNIAWKVQARGGDVWEVYHDIASYLLQTTSENVVGRRSPRKRSPTRVYRTTSQVIHSTQPKVPPARGMRAMSAGAVSKKLRSRVGGLKGIPPDQGLKEPEIGDRVLISAEQSARIVALPESRVAVLQMNNKAVTSPPDAYLYADTHGLVWDQQQSCWTRDNLAADLSSSRLSSTPSPEYHLSSNLSSTLLEGSVSTLRSTTPESLQSGHTGRPHSQMSFISDDLQTIPSQEELEIEESLPALSMRVDIATSGSSVVYEASKTEHQRSVLQQYVVESDETEGDTGSSVTSLLQQGDTKSTNMSVTTLDQKDTRLDDIHRRTRVDSTVAMDSLSFSDQSGGFQVPTPQLHLSEVWESGKSVPSASGHSSSKRPHSCHHAEFQRQVAKVEPHMPPSSSLIHHTAPPTSTDPALSASISTLSLKSILGQVTPSNSAESSAMGYQPVTYNAWTTAVPSTPSTRHTALTSSRLMTKRHPKMPPITRKTDSSSHWRSNTKPSPSSVILQQKPSAHQAKQKPPQHMSAYSAHAERSVNKYRYQPPSAQTPSKTTRRLGDLGNFYIGGTSIG